MVSSYEMTSILHSTVLFLNIQLRAQLCVWPFLTNILFIANPWQYKLFYYFLLYGISHGFDRIHDLLVMTWHLKDILRYFKEFF